MKDLYLIQIYSGLLLDKRYVYGRKNADKVYEGYVKSYGPLKCALWETKRAFNGEIIPGNRIKG